MFRRAQNDPFNDRGLQRGGNQLFGGIVPADQIDALPAELIDDFLDALAAETEAGGEAIHTWILALQGEFAAVSGLTRDSLDLDTSRGDLGHLSRKELGDHVDV